MNRCLPLIVLIPALLLGCESPGNPGNPGPLANSHTPSSHAPAHATPDPNAAAKPVAYINGRAVTQQDLQAPLIEAAGGTVLAELVLDRQLRQRLLDRRIDLTPDLIAQEKAIMLDTLADDPDEAVRLLNAMRDSRGLGEHRFQGLLFRNAALRQLVRDEVELAPALLRQAYELRHGQRYRVRLLVSETMAQASRLRDRALAGEPFADLAALHSTDPSAAQGGLLSPISPLDPTYPSALRQAMQALEPGGVSDLIAVDNRFIIIRLEEVLPPDDISYEAALPELARRVRREAEGQRMQQAARTLLTEAKVVVLDPALNQRWQVQQQRTRTE